MGRGTGNTATAPALSRSAQSALEVAEEVFFSYEDFEAAHAVPALLLSEEKIENGGPGATWARFLLEVEVATEQRWPDADKRLDDFSQGLAGRSFEQLSDEFLMRMQSGSKPLTVRERAEIAIDLFDELEKLDPDTAADLRDKPVLHNHPMSSVASKGVTYAQALQSFADASDKSWENIDGDPDNLAAVLLGTEVNVMIRDLKHYLGQD